MKFYYWLFFTLLVVFACKQPDKKIEQTNEEQQTSPDTTIAPSTNVVEEYASFVATLDTLNVYSISKAAQKFEVLFAKADSTKADSGYIVFSKLYDKINSVLNDQNVKDSTNYDAYVSGNEPNGTKTRKATERVKKLKENGFAFDMTEGSTYIREDRNFLAQYFYPRVSKTMRDYLVEVNKENEEGFIDDAGLLITPLALSERILWWEAFLKQHPSFAFVDEIKQMQKGYITFLLQGIDNTPLINYNTKKIEKN